MFENDNLLQDNQAEEYATLKCSTFHLSGSTIQNKRSEDMDDPNYHKSVLQASHSVICSAAMRQTVEDLDPRHHKNMKDLVETLTEKYTE